MADKWIPKIEIGKMNSVRQKKMSTSRPGKTLTRVKKSKRCNPLYKMAEMELMENVAVNTYGKIKSVNVIKSEEIDTDAQSEDCILYDLEFICTLGKVVSTAKKTENYDFNSKKWVDHIVNSWDGLRLINKKKIIID